MKIEEFEDVLAKENCAFVCGNGFSINFDDGFGNIYDRLPIVHKDMLVNTKYEVMPTNLFLKNRLINNYNALLQKLKNIDDKEFDKIFYDGIAFAQSIIDNDGLVQILYSEGIVSKLVFGKSQIDIISSIAKIGETRGYKYVNIEYWPMLIYLYFGISRIDSTNYSFPTSNLFIELIKAGNVDTTVLAPSISKMGDSIFDTMLNGFNIYYRILFGSAILNAGKAVHFDMLGNISKLDLKSINTFLNSFKTCFTLNYDKIIENFVGEDNTIHLHGSFELNAIRYFYNQSIGEYVDGNRVDYSDILIGDYHVNKTFLRNMTAGMKKDGRNTIPDKHSDIFTSAFKQNHINVLVVFGMAIDNDQHIIREIMLCLEALRVKDAKIIYCYFADSDKDSFEEQYNNSITFHPIVNEYVRNIQVSYIQTKEILKRYFGK